MNLTDDEIIAVIGLLGAASFLVMLGAVIYAGVWFIDWAFRTNVVEGIDKILKQIGI